MIKLITTQKDRPLIIFNNFTFRLFKINRNCVIWRCCDKECTVRGKSSLNFCINLESFVATNEHNHNVDMNEIVKKEKVYEMKQLIEKTLCSPRYAINKTLSGSDIGTISAVGSIDCMSKKLRQYRSKLINPPPYLFPNLLLSKKLSETHSRFKFFQYGIDNYGTYQQSEDILLFFSSYQIENLKINKIWCVDGTFQVVPSPWYQLYTISYIINNRVFPAIFAILKNKKQKTYEDMYSFIKLFEPNLNPRVIKTDFEISAINAIKIKFPNATISGCQFHLGQCLVRKLKDFNLFYLYKSEQRIKKFVKALIALSYVDVNQ
jgi:hypothetical protein